MISKSLIEMTKGRWREFVREPSAIIFVISMPIIWMIVLGIAFSGDNKEQYKVGIIDNPSYAAMNESLSKPLFQDHDQIKIRKDSEDSLRNLLKTGKIQVILKWQDETLTYIFDSTNPQATAGKLVINDALQNQMGRIDPTPSIIEEVKTPGSRYIDFLIPGLLALSIMTTSFFGIGMMIVLHRRDNLLKRYLTTPMNTFEYFASHIIGRNLMLLVEFAAIFLAGFLLFDFQVSGSIISYIIFSVLGASCFTAIAIFFAARATDTGAYNGKTNILILPIMMLSGIWFSRSTFPDWLATISEYIPLSALVDGLRKIALEGTSIMDLGFEAAILLTCTLVFILAAKSRFKWY